MIFQKASTRTRVSFETGMYQLGGQPLFLSSNDLQIGRGEPVQDTARVLSRYLDGIMIRTFKQEEVDSLAEYGSIPVINGLTDLSHPCQVLADLLTIREYKNKLDGLNFCYTGDGNNMANSLTVGCLKVGMNVSLACPTGYYPSDTVMEFVKQYPNQFKIVNDPWKPPKAPMYFIPTFGRPWDRKEKRRSGKKRSGVIRSTMRLWRSRIPNAWFFIVSRA